MTTLPSAYATVIHSDREREEQPALHELKEAPQVAFALPDSEVVEMDFARFKERRNSSHA